jgi:hypothetical protein
VRDDKQGLRTVELNELLYFYGVEQISIIYSGLALWALLISFAALLHATQVAVFIILIREMVFGSK